MIKKSTKKLMKGKDYVGVGIGAVIINDEGKMLLAQRGPKAKNERGKWEFPGGGVEFGDTMEETIKREMKEELGIIIETYQQLPVLDHIIKDEAQHWITSGFIAKIKKGTPAIKEFEKCSGIGWFSLKEMEKLPLSIPTSAYVNILKKIGY